MSNSALLCAGPVSSERGLPLPRLRIVREPLRRNRFSPKVARKVSATALPLARPLRVFREEKSPSREFQERHCLKTITEYRPLIFGEMQARLERREMRRKAQRSDFWTALVYGVVGWAVMAAIGSTVCEWQFWMVFAPIFLGSELALREITRLRRPAA